ncbi:MAG: Quinoprotein glucose dehydrogenase [Pseudomonadales bacterium]|nr:Quinoprotein glucose dehydrogenase [Pseudomonadales bacterium]
MNADHSSATLNAPGDTPLPVLARHLLAVTLFASLCACQREAPAEFPPGAEAEWPAYGAAPGGGHYSAATQITRENVRLLRPAWVYRSGDLRLPRPANPEAGEPMGVRASSWQLTPILVGDTLYGCTAFNKVFALDPATGKEKWRYDPGVDTDREVMVNCRGVASWKDPNPRGAACEHRILTGTLDGRLIALDARDGTPCRDFGDQGQVDLHAGLGQFEEYEYSVTSPPAILGDRVITGALVLDRTHNHMPSGVVRAYDVRSGRLLWYWDPIPPGASHAVDEAGRPRYRRGTPNVWSIISVDAARDLVFLPTGNTSTDFYGGLRDGSDHYSSSVVALRGTTGELVWHFQAVHHDIWDFDTPAQPTLFDLRRDGQRIPALAQPTKMGHLFILHRETGEPLFPVEERPVPQDWEVPGEYLAPTQPFPVKPSPLHPHRLAAEDAWGFTFWDRGACRRRIASLRNEGIFTPPSLDGTLFYPSDMGGNNWGTPAIDPERGLLVLNTLFMPAELKLIPRERCDMASGDPYLTPQHETPYCLRIEPLMSPLGVPCSAPPWGTLSAIDLASGEKRWEVPLGTLEHMAPWPFSRLRGAPNIGGPSVTASGLTFIAATPDRYLRAFDSETGEELWKGELPAGGHATPMIYKRAGDGRQFVVIAAAGHFGMPDLAFSDQLVAFALPEAHPRDPR